MPLYRRLPKRGFTNIFALSFAELTLQRLQEGIEKGVIDTTKPITEETLAKANLVRRVLDGVRLLGTGELTSKVILEITGATKSALSAVEKAGGSVKLKEPKKVWKKAPRVIAQ